MKKCITSVYYLVSNFSKIYQEWEKSNLIPSIMQRRRDGILSICELMTIVLYFYLSPCRDFKNYYLYYLSHKYRGYFTLPCYSRIIQLWPRLIIPLAIMMQLLKGQNSGIYFIDSTKLAICHRKRTSSNRVFGKVARVGMSSYGWFMGFKLHLVVNIKGEIMAIKLTKANVNDIFAADCVTKGLYGKLFGDKGYISKDLSRSLYSRNLRLFSGIRRDMRNHLLELEDKILMRKRSIIESVFNVLKNHMNLEHSRHRSPINFLVHIMACVTSYAITKSNLDLDNLHMHNPSLS